MKILITGGQGFVGSYICQDLLDNGHSVVSIDNYQKYGKVNRPQDTRKNFTLYDCNILSNEFFDIFNKEKPDVVIACAAIIGGISLFHAKAYDLLAMNERILANTFDAAISGYKEGFLKRIIVLSSSMVFENTKTYPTPESDVSISPPPSSTYGFQKLAAEYFAKGAFEQYGLPFSIVRPFNAVGVGEDKALCEKKITSGNVELMMSHVLPDLINKCLKGQNPLILLGSGQQIRCFTNGKDLARGIRLVIESDKAINNDFNISTSRATSVLELAEVVWNKVNPHIPFKYSLEGGFEYDVQKRIPDVSKAKEILGFEANISLEQSVDEVIEYIKSKND